MTFPRLLPIMVVLLLWNGAALARLGENASQCQDRYGAPIMDTTGLNQKTPLIPGMPHAIYYHQGWVIRVAFLNGVAASIKYCKVPLTGWGSEIHSSEFALIRAAEAGGLAWQPSKAHVWTMATDQNGNVHPNDPKSSSQIWNRSDGVQAMLEPGWTAVTVQTSAAAKLKSAWKSPERIAFGRPEF